MCRCVEIRHIPWVGRTSIIFFPEYTIVSLILISSLIISLDNTFFKCHLNFLDYFMSYFTADGGFSKNLPLSSNRLSGII